MSSYELRFYTFDDQGERTGATTRLATISDGDIKGRMRRIVEEVISLGVVDIGVTGPIVRVTENDPDLVAYALALRSAALWDAGVVDDGIVVAVDENDVEIPFRYAKEPPVSDLVGVTAQENIDPLPVD